MSALRTPCKPERRRGVDGRFRCYRCPGELAVAGVREKCCRNCLLLLVKKAFAAELACLRQKLAEHHRQQQSVCAGSTSQEYKLCNEGLPLFVAISGGDASFSLLHMANEVIQKRQRAHFMQRQKSSCQRVRPLEGKGPPAQEVDFACCVALHVDMQRLFLPPASVVEMRASTASQDQGITDGSTTGMRATEFEEGWETVRGLWRSVPSGQSLPLQLQQAVRRQCPAVRCVLLHPSGAEFAVVEKPDAEQHSGGYVEVYRRPGDDSCAREQLAAILQEDQLLRQLLAQTFAEDKTAAEHLCRAIM